MRTTLAWPGLDGSTRPMASWPLTVNQPVVVALGTSPLSAEIWRWIVDLGDWLRRQIGRASAAMLRYARYLIVLVGVS